LSSLAHTFAPETGILYDNLNDKEKYNAWQRYGETKMANIHFTRALQEKLTAVGASNVFVNAVHPGVVQTELTRNLAEPRKWSLTGVFINFARVDEFKGALTQIFAAGAKEIEKKGCKGQYFVPYCTLAEPNAAAQNADYIQKTWDWTEKILREKLNPKWSWSSVLSSQK
jgi:WW domain-containing oxidoreductase